MEHVMRATSRLAGSLLILVAALPGFTTTVQADGARGLVRLLEGGDRDPGPANPRVQTWTVTEALAYVNRRGDVEVMLGTGDVPLDGFPDAIDPSSWIRTHVRAAGARRLTFSVRGDPSHSSVHAYIGDVVFTPASSGTVYGARIEDGRLRGRLVTTGGLRGSLFTDVQLDVPLWRAPAHQPLPPDGGEPGVALMALEKATQAMDADAIRALLGPALLADFPDREAFEQEGPKLKEQFGSGHRVQKGLVHRDSAILISTATSRGRQLPVRTMWQRIDGRWKFTSMSFNTTELLDTEARPKPFVNVEPVPSELADQPQVRLDNGQWTQTLRHARAMALGSGEHVVVFSDRPLAKLTPPPTSSQPLRWSALSDDSEAKLMVILLPAGGPEWDLEDVLHGTATQPPDSSLVNGELTRIGDRLSGVFTTLRFPASGGVEDGESVLIDLPVE
jgi:hypothetical protein